MVLGENKINFYRIVVLIAHFFQIKVSLMGDNCSMKYLLRSMEPSLFSTLFVKISSFSNNKNNVSLFYIESNQTRYQFMDLRLTNNMVVFKWQLDKEPRKVSLQVGKEKIESILVERYIKYKVSKISVFKPLCFTEWHIV